jgi:hypothetical protein
MPASKLSLFNGAQRLLKDRKLSAAEVTGNTREPARILNDIWDAGALDECLQAGQWKFATRTARIDASSSATPDFGFKYVFEKPDDFVRLTGVWSDENMQHPHRQYREEAGFWFGSLETMFVSYVSNDAMFGADFSLWPANFVNFVEAHLASKAAGPLAEQGVELLKIRKMLLDEANGTDAMSDPSRSLPVGSWASSRGSSYRRGERF